MNVEELSMIGPDVDLRKVDAINKKRLLAFVNSFIINTTLFLNKLAKSCEYGLMMLEYKIQKLETSIIMLESKLNSIPGLEDNSSLKSLELDRQPKKDEIQENIVETKTENDEEGGSDKLDTDTVQELDPELMKYVKMLQFGVPLPAVKLKMEQENVVASLQDLVINYNK